MTIRSISNDLKNSLLPDNVDYKEGFSYAHLIKFEKALPISTSGVPSKSALSYAYITDASTNLTFDDGSVDNSGTSNGVQTYIANRVLQVGSVAETTKARATNLNIDIDTIALGTNVSGINITYSANSIATNVDLVDAGFAEGDKLKITASSLSNVGKTLRLDKFSNGNKTASFSTEDTITTGSGTSETLEFASEEVIGLLNKKESVSYAGYINREVFVYKAHIDPDTGLIIGDPYLQFKGIISSAKLSEDPTSQSKISWSIASHWGDFVRVNGRTTSDSSHRGQDSLGNSDVAALKRPEYASDLGFMHSEQAINIIGIYQVKETRYKLKSKSKFFGLKKKYKQVEYTVEVDREADLRFNLDAKYIPVVYGVQKIDAIPFFADTKKDSANIVYVAYALCEGEIGGLYDIYFDESSSICLSKQDSDTRSETTNSEGVDVYCKGRMDRGDALGPESFATGTLFTNGTNGTYLFTGIGLENGTPTIGADFSDYSNFLNAAAASTPISSTGLLHTEASAFDKPIDSRIVFHAGKSDQKADPVLTYVAATGTPGNPSYTADGGFKIQADYFEGAGEYWGTNHQVLDTAYVVAQYTLSEGEAAIPELDFVVRGKLLNCYNYDFSYRGNPQGGESITNFSIGDAVTLYSITDPTGNTPLGTNTIAEIYTLPEETEPRVRLQNNPYPGLGSVTSFYIKSGANTWHMLASSHEEVSGSVAAKAEEQIQTPSTDISAGTDQGVKVEIDLTSDAGASINNTNYKVDIGLIKTPSEDIDTAAIIKAVRQLSSPGYDRSAAGGNLVLDNIGTQQDLPTTRTEIQHVVNKNAVILDSSASTTNDIYNGYLIEVTRVQSNGQKDVQTRTIVDYHGSTRTATVTEAFSTFIPDTTDTYKIICPEDLRVSLNPAIQLLDYMTNTRYGKGLSLEEDIDLNAFLNAALECDTRSDICVESSDTPVVGDVYNYSTSGKFVWQGTVDAVDGSKITFTDNIGKLGKRWFDWKTYEVGDLVYKSDGTLYEKTGSDGTIPEDFSTGVSSIGSVSLNRVGGGSSLALNITNKTSSGNSLVKQLGAGEGYLDGYSLYDSDDVIYWKYLGWKSQDQDSVTRHQLNTVLDTSSSIFDNINSLLEQFNGILRYSNGKYQLDIETAAPSSFDSAEELSEEDIIGSINVEDAGQKGTFNTVSVGISDPANRFDSRNVSFFDSRYLREDRNVEKKGDFKTPYITNYFNARINARQYLEQSRYGLKISFKMAPKGLLLVAGSIIKLSYPRFDWTDKYFRITNLSFTPDCLVQVTAEEHNDGAYLLSSIPPQRYISDQLSTAADPTPAPPTSLTATTAKEGIQLTWTNTSQFNPAKYVAEIYRSTQNDIAGSPAPQLVGTSQGTSFTDFVITNSPTTFYYWVRYAVTTTKSKRTSTDIARQIFSEYEPTSIGVSGTTSGSIDGVNITIDKPTFVLEKDPSNPANYIYTGSGATIRAYIGSYQLNYDGDVSGGYDNLSFRVENITASDITAGAQSSGTGTSPPQNFVSFADASAFVDIGAFIEYEIIITDGVGEEYPSFFVRQSFAAGSLAQLVKLESEDYSIIYDELGSNPSYTPGAPSTITVTASTQGYTLPYFRFKIAGGSFGSWSSSSTYEYTVPTYASITNWAPGSDIIVVEAREGITGPATSTDSISIARVKSGENALVGVLTNEAHVAPADTNGSNPVLTGSGGTFEVYYKGASVNTPATFSGGATKNGLTLSINSSGVYSLSGSSWSSDSETFNLTATYTPTGAPAGGYTITKTYTISKAKAGVNGTNGTNGAAGVDAVVVQLTSNDYSIVYNSSGASPSPSGNLTLTATSQNVDTPWFKFTGDGFTDQTSFSAGNTLSWSIPANYFSTPQTVRVGVSDGDQVELAFDTITITAVQPGQNTVTAIVTNEAHTLPADNSGTVTSYSGSGTQIEAYEGSTQLTYDSSAPYATPSWRIGAVTDTNITVGSASGTTTRTYGNHSNMTADNASITYPITIVDSDGNETTFNKQQSFSKSIKGDNGAGGVDAVVVQLTSNDYSIVYNSSGASPSPSGNLTLTATSQNVDTPWFKFTGDGFTDQTSFSAGNTLSWSIPANYFSTPQTVRVGVSDGDQVELAFDTITITAVQPGQNTVTAIVTNEAHTLPADNSGTVTSYSGSGTQIEAYEGSTQLTYDSSAPYATPSWRIGAVTDTNITVGSASGTTTRTYGDHSNMTADNASITYPITIVDSDGNESTFNKQQSFSKSIKGDDGAGGVDAVVVQLTSNDYSIVYNSSGASPSPSGNLTLTATSQNVDTPWFKFTGDGFTDQTSFSAGSTLSWSIPANYFSTPQTVRVGVSDGDQVELAFDSITITAVQPGQNTVIAIVTNEAHTLPADNSGTVTSYSGSGTQIEAYEGSTQLTYDSSAPYATPSWRIGAVTDTNITVGSASGTTTRTYGDHSNMTADNASITYPITIVDSDGNETTFNKQQSFSKSKGGDQGEEGLRTVQGYLYYEKTTAGNPPTPGSTTYTFSSGDIDGGSGTSEVLALADTSAVNKWTNEPRTLDPTSSNQHYTIRYYGTEAAANSTTVSVTYSNIVSFTEFSGVVRFSGGTLVDDTNTFDPADKIDTGSAAADINTNTTTIDGGKITTGSITTDRLDATSVLGQKFEVGTNGYISTQSVTYSTGTGFFLGYDSTAYKFRIGSTTNNLSWDGTNLSITGSSSSTSKVTIGDWSIDGDSIFCSTKDGNGNYVGAGGGITIRSDHPDYGAGIHTPIFYVQTGDHADGGATTAQRGIGIRAGKSNYGGTAGGFFLEKTDMATLNSPYRLDVGNSTNYLRWSGSALEVRGTVKFSGGTELTEATVLNSNTTATNVGLGNVENLDPENQTKTGIESQVVITGGGIVLSGGGHVKSVNKDQVVDPTAGFFLGYDTNLSDYGFSIGDGTDYIRWNGSTLSVGGDIIATGNIQANAITNASGILASSAVDTTELAAEAATGGSSDGGFTTTGLTNSWINVADITLDLEAGETVAIWWMLYVRATTGSNSVAVKIFEGPSVGTGSQKYISDFYTVPLTARNIMSMGSFSATGGTSRVLTLQARALTATPTVDIDDSEFIAIQLKR